MELSKNTSLSIDNDTSQVITPLSMLTDLGSGEWMTLPPDDPVRDYIAQNLWTKSSQPGDWEVARFSRAVYLYRETTTEQTLVVKYYSEKSGFNAERYATRELQFIERILDSGLANGKLRTLQPLGSWGGALFLEHVKGLTLGDIIAVRQSQPGSLHSALAGTAAFLGKLHTNGDRPPEPPNIESALKDTHKYINQLASSSLLENEPTTVAGLHRLIEAWKQRPTLLQYTPSLTHGDATTTNFIFPEDGSVVAIDWERLKIADPAADIGRLAAEISHSLQQQGGSGTEVDCLVDHLTSAYFQAVGAETQTMQERITFYQASSTLRIARNGWLSRLERMMLVAQAMALLV